MMKGKTKVIIIICELFVIAGLLIFIACTRIGGNGAQPGTQSSSASAGGNGETSDDKYSEDITDMPAESTEPVLSPEEQAELERALKEQEEEAARIAAEEAEKAAAEEKAAQIELIEIEAENLVATYDFNGAIEILKEIEDYEQDETVLSLISDYEAQRDACVVWPDNSQISHLFVHSLIVDTERAFSKYSSQPVGYNQYMTTVEEFNKMLEQMYERGYVLVSVHDMAERVVDEDGNEKLVKKDIILPEGKTPFVLSQDDVNYYAYMENDGFASRLVVGEDGLPTCEYIDKDGNVLYGEYDVVPIVDRFVKEHPDFAYHGHKGILAVTGYEGALGYDTGLSMKKYDGMDEAQKMELINSEREAATKVADALKADGWEFASHSYTHTNMTTNSVSKVEYDLTRWRDEVEIILGETDIYLYPFGADICDWRSYTGEKYDLMKEFGFWYFCNVDSARYWVQIRDQYFRMGRINADGERMMKHPEKLSYFFDVSTVLDTSRPSLN